MNVLNPLLPRLRPLSWLLVALASSSLQAQVLGAQPSSGRTLGDPYSSMATVAQELSRIVVYRASSSKSVGGVVSVHFNNHFHTALQANAFSAVCLQGDRLEVSSRFTSVLVDPKSTADVRSQLPIKGGESLYLRVSPTEGGQVRIETVQAAVANAELSSARQQLHTISRLPNALPCRPETPIRIIYDPYKVSTGLPRSQQRLNS